MIAFIIFVFLVGAVLAWAFRVWILIPLSVLAFIGSIAFGLIFEDRLWAVIVGGLVGGMAPQFGYAFGLLSHHVLSSNRSMRPLLFRKAASRRHHSQESLDQTQ